MQSVACCSSWRLSAKETGAERARRCKADPDAALEGRCGKEFQARASRSLGEAARGATDAPPPFPSPSFSRLHRRSPSLRRKSRSDSSLRPAASSLAGRAHTRVLCCRGPSSARSSPRPPRRPRSPRRRARATASRFRLASPVGSAASSPVRPFPSPRKDPRPPSISSSLSPDPPPLSRDPQLSSPLRGRRTACASASLTKEAHGASPCLRYRRWIERALTRSSS